MNAVRPARHPEPSAPAWDRQELKRRQKWAARLRAKGIEARAEECPERGASSMARCDERPLRLDPRRVFRDPEAAWLVAFEDAMGEGRRA